MCHEDPMISFEKKFSEQFQALYQMLESLYQPQKVKTEQIQEIDTEDEDSNGTSAYRINVLKNRQLQLETIIDVLVTRLEQKRKENLHLLQMLLDCNEKEK